jgi:2-oxoglutarate ferredoxin oxidoreductase subunit delta
VTARSRSGRLFAPELEGRDMRYWRKPLDIDSVTVPHVEYCPKDVLVMSERFNAKGYHPPEVVKTGECVNCNLCEMICPDFAIFSVASGGAKVPEQKEAAN